MTVKYQKKIIRKIMDRPNTSIMDGTHQVLFKVGYYSMHNSIDNLLCSEWKTGLPQVKKYINHYPWFCMGLGTNQTPPSDFSLDTRLTSTIDTPSLFPPLVRECTTCILADLWSVFPHVKRITTWWRSHFKIWFRTCISLARGEWDP